MRDPELRGASITVTAVDVSPDLRNATAFGMPLGGQDEPRLLAAMRRAAPWFRARVGEKAGLRYAPEIRFEVDRTFDEADRIGQLLRPPRGRATSRTIEVVLVARKEVGVGRVCRHGLAVVQHLDLLVLEPFQQFATIDARRRQMDVDLRSRQQFQDLVA